MKEYFVKAKERFVYRAKRLGKAVNDTFVSIKDWAKENPETAATLGISLGAAAIHTSRSMIVTHRLKVQQRMQNYRIYDRSLGTYWNLKKPLTNNDRKRLDAYRAKGNSLSEALSKLGKI